MPKVRKATSSSLPSHRGAGALTPGRSRKTIRNSIDAEDIEIWSSSDSNRAADFSPTSPAEPDAATLDLETEVFASPNLQEIRADSGGSPCRQNPNAGTGDAVNSLPPVPNIPRYNIGGTSTLGSTPSGFEFESTGEARALLEIQEIRADMSKQNAEYNAGIKAITDQLSTVASTMMSGFSSFQADATQKMADMQSQQTATVNAVQSIGDRVAAI